MSTRDERILQALVELKPVDIKLVNDSHKHAGHTQHLGGAGFTGDTHYKLQIVSDLFKGVSRIDRQRMVMDLLKPEFASGLHALEIKARSPEEV
ncbi:BolA family protein [Pseudobdellovibrio exovorus]|uniref:BolA-like protein n=1 Tax=Pseudobdellovibrio exovorus JSS TaxID=1184267 RepID=M4VBH4_9BACT|nr:BolA family protein [Pseudobdellovibrio exovorus]AGH95835.1 BolA-like protein [Pseudobdellovibrio exovorus JSS]